MTAILLGLVQLQAQQDAGAALHHQVAAAVECL